MAQLCQKKKNPNKTTKAEQSPVASLPAQQKQLSRGTEGMVWVRAPGLGEAAGKVQAQLPLCYSCQSWSVWIYLLRTRQLWHISLCSHPCNTLQKTPQKQLWHPWGSVLT